MHMEKCPPGSKASSPAGTFFPAFVYFWKKTCYTFLVWLIGSEEGVFVEKRWLLPAAILTGVLAAAGLAAVVMQPAGRGWYGLLLALALCAAGAWAGALGHLARRYVRLRHDARLIRLLRGEALPLQDGEKTEAEAAFPYADFCAVIFTVDDASEFSGTEEALRARVAGAMGAQQFAKGRFALDSVWIDGALCCLLNFSLGEMGVASAQQALRRCLLAVLEELENSCGLLLSCAASGFARGVEGVAAAYGEARRVNAYRDMLMLEEKLLLFDEMSLDRRRVTALTGSESAFAMPDGGFALEQEKVLINCILTHDYAAAKEAMEALLDAEFQGESAPFIEMAPYRLYGLVNTLINAVDYLRPDVESDFYAALIPGLDLTHVGSPQELKEKMGYLFDQFLRYTQERKVQAAPEWVEQMRRYIEDEYRNPDLNINTLADHFGLHPTYASRSFKAYTGSGILEYLQRRRIEAAKSLLAGGASVKETAAAAGFSNPRTMTRVFNKYEGISPGKFRT